MKNIQKVLLLISVLPYAPVFCSYSYTHNNTRIRIIQGDITTLTGHDALVNAANTHLQHGGGVARAIAHACGKQLQQYCMAMPSLGTARGEKCQVGHAVVTPSFKLIKNGVKYIIHAVGPRIPHGTLPTACHEKQLYDAYFDSLLLARHNKCSSIAFPAISTAIFGYDIKLATPIAFKAVTDFINQYPDALKTISFVLFSADDYTLYVNTVSQKTHPTTLSIAPRFAPIIAWVRKKLL
jgi:O-acetyl-ADP-ribose deacetylase